MTVETKTKALNAGLLLLLIAWLIGVIYGSARVQNDKPVTLTGKDSHWSVDEAPAASPPPELEGADWESGAPAPTPQ